jgi:hypothetical protein
VGWEIRKAAFSFDQCDQAGQCGRRRAGLKADHIVLRRAML